MVLTVAIKGDSAFLPLSCSCKLITTMASDVRIPLYPHPLQ